MARLQPGDGKLITFMKRPETKNVALWKNRDMISIFNTSDEGKKVVFRLAHKNC